MDKANLRENLIPLSYQNIDWRNESVIVRACLNVILDDQGKIIDDTRLIEALPLIRELAQKCSRVIIMAHLGRPMGVDSKLSLEPVRKLLVEELGIQITLVSDISAEIPEQGVFLLENIRFFPGEEAEVENVRMDFAKKLAGLAHYYINDAFPDYRQSASTYDIVKFIPSYLGPAFISEVVSLTKLISPKRPYLAIIGGAKLSEKLDLLNVLAEIADQILIGGAMAYTLLRAKGIEVGKSLVEEDKIPNTQALLAKYSDKIILPLDHLVVDKFSKDDNGGFQLIDSEEIPSSKIAVDIGPKTITDYANRIKSASTILWNGPLGVFEWEESSKGTRAIATEILINKQAYSLVGGGDSISAINQFGLSGYSHISTGGGAMLAFIAKDEFPTLAVIMANHFQNLTPITEPRKLASPKAIIVYGTCGGNAELVSQNIQKGLELEHITTEISRGEIVDLKRVLSSDLIILVCATYNVGELQDYYIKFEHELRKQDLKNKPIAVVGLGDSKHYDIFCGAADILEETIKLTHANQIVPTLKIDGQPHPHLDEYLTWGRNLAKSFKQII